MKYQPSSSPPHRITEVPSPHNIVKGPSVHRWAQISTKHNSSSSPSTMNHSSPMDPSQRPSINHSHLVGGNAYSVQTAYGGWPQNSQVCQPSAPRSMASGNWRGSQSSADPINTTTGTSNYTLMSSPVQLSPPSNDGGPVSISDRLNGYAYCVKRPDGRYTRLVPADMLPGLNELPATQASAQGMVLLPSLHMQPPQGVAGMNQPVTVKNRIDRIVATTSPAQQRKTKIYCDKWIHDGTCAFTQQGCKYKHEMPFDKATQQSLGLFHGFPKWWRDHQEELQKQLNRNSSTSRSQAILQLDWRGDSNEDTSKTATVQAPIGAERNQQLNKGNRLSQTHEGMASAIAVEQRPRTGSEIDWIMSSSTGQGWNGSSPRSSTSSADLAYVLQ
ncbi:hypothetical protein F53441_3148 [Fusarium austroafricanum]|uniref:C3H1-type domain-containing protein n=1 Tax=Fusarium austroafricanum TaxID=2364996 RepID=A0A8H4KQ57_9HYPO|nr:hypothetical protein F53441_3148 [Fusarium austroafricanum]